LRRLTLIGAITLVVVVLFGLTELLLPPLATHVARDRLSKYGPVESLSVSAFPAVELIWGDVDSMTVKMGSYRATGSKLSTALGQSEQVGNINATIGTLHSGLVTMQNVTASKHGKTFTVSGDLTESDIKSAVPLLTSVRALGESNGALNLAATGSAFGIQASVDVSLFASGGVVEVQAQGLLSSFVHLTLFSNPRLYITSLSGHATSDGLSVTATGQLR
jgi:hypothetical protein